MAIINLKRRQSEKLGGPLLMTITRAMLGLNSRVSSTKQTAQMRKTRMHMLMKLWLQVLTLKMPKKKKKKVMTAKQRQQRQMRRQNR